VRKILVRDFSFGMKIWARRFASLNIVAEIFAYIVSSLKRVHAAKPRVEELNPLVVVETIAVFDSVEINKLDNVLQSVDLVCITDCNRDTIVSHFYVQ
jgi:hypothetical protein